MELGPNPGYTMCFLRTHLFISLLVAVYILATMHETGDQAWVWIPIIVLFPIFGLLAYLIYRIARRNQDKQWEREQMKADSGRGKYTSRRVKGEKELKDDYYQGRRRR